MRLELIRYAAFPDRTLGVVRIDGGKAFYVVERPWVDNAPYVSCIPEGVYPLRRHDSTKFKAMQERHDGDLTWEIHGVSDRTVILFHTANTASDLHGCVGVGSTVYANLAGVGNSRAATTDFYRATSDDFEGTIEIKSGAIPADWVLE